jgi:hypothetical protein
MKVSNGLRPSSTASAFPLRYWLQRKEFLFCGIAVADIKKLREELAAVLKNSVEQPSSITQLQSAVPLIGSRKGWENVITITDVHGTR